MIDFPDTTTSTPTKTGSVRLVPHRSKPSNPNALRVSCWRHRTALKPLSNPFTVEEYGSAQAASDGYEVLFTELSSNAFKDAPELGKELDRLIFALNSGRDVELLCCGDKPDCHCVVIASYLEAVTDERIDAIDRENRPGAYQ